MILRVFQGTTSSLLEVDREGGVGVETNILSPREQVFQQLPPSETHDQTAHASHGEEGADVAPQG